MAVDDARYYELTGAINHLRIGRSFHGIADRGNFAVLDQDVALGDRAVRHGQDRGITNENHRCNRSVRGSRRRLSRGKKREGNGGDNGKHSNKAKRSVHSAPPGAAAVAGFVPVKSNLYSPAPIV